MEQDTSRMLRIETLAGDGELDALRSLFAENHTQQELDAALENAIAYSRNEVADFLINKGADITWNNYSGVYYAVHNNELEGLKHAVKKGVDINVSNGMLLNTGIETAINTRSCEIVIWMLQNGARIDLLTKRSHDLLREYASSELKLVIYGT